MDPVNISAKFKVRSFTRSWDNRGYSKKLGQSLDTPRLHLLPNSKGLLFGWTLWIYLPNLKFVALSVPEIIGGTQKNWQSLYTPTLHFLPNFSWACVRMDPVNVSAKFAVHIVCRSWDNSDCSLGVGLWTPNLGEGEAVGGPRWHRSKERWWLPIGSP